MGRINTNIQSLLAQRVLANNNSSLNVALERLSTGLRINRGKDDPAGVIASQNLKSEQRGLNEAVRNTERADQVANIAEGGLQEVSSLLAELQGIVVGTASRSGLSDEERKANQLVVDSILQTVDRISSSTNFQGTKLLNGEMDFRVSSIATGVADIRVGAAKYAGSSLNIDIGVTASAQQAGLFLSAGGSSLNLNTGSSLVLEIGGSRGARELSFSSGTALTAVRDAINTYTQATGVEAVVSGTGIVLRSQDYGSEEVVSVRVLNAAGINSTTNGDGGTPARGVYNLQNTNFGAANTTIQSTFANAGNAVRDNGRDVTASVNGVQATSSGRKIRVNTDFLEVDVTLTAGQSTTLGNVGGSNSAFVITGGGAQFSLDSRVDIAARASLGIQATSSNRLGNTDLGMLSSLGSGNANNLVNGDLTQAQKIITEASRQVSTLRGRLGNFQKSVLGATARSLAITAENTAAAESVISDANFAYETAQLTRSQILVNASTNILSLANQSPNAALQLLG